MAPKGKVAVDETIVVEKEIEPFDWEDHLYESWMEEHMEQKRSKPTDTGV
jgi:hypothetical protein